MDATIEVVNKTVAQHKDLFYKISQEIWSNPELMFKEFYAHQLLTDHLEKLGFEVERNYILPTGFKARFASSNAANGPVLAIICEYDALPNLGHACGHNLIAEAGFAAGLAVKAAIQADETLRGTVVVLGTPAEEGGGGKIEFIKSGAFDDIDVAMMVHPTTTDVVFMSSLAIKQMSAIFKGKSSHASSWPWEAKNALDAAVNAYSSIGLLRQQIHPECRIGAIISDGGVVTNVIPDKSEIKFGIRAVTMAELDLLVEKVKSCCIAGANAAGCTVEFKIGEDPYDSVFSNVPLGLKFKYHANSLGMQFVDSEESFSKASTDMGNVSQVVPSIHPVYKIADVPNHTVEFAREAGREDAQDSTLNAAKAMALTCISILREKNFLEEIKNYFNKHKQQIK